MVIVFCLHMQILTEDTKPKAIKNFIDMKIILLVAPVGFIASKFNRKSAS